MNTPKNNYLVSVIMPTYNRGKNIQTAINSIINQSLGMENIELIIVDDGSTDNTTQKTILYYQNKYPNNIKPIFLDKNSGYPGKPRNIGLQNINSDYVLFSDDDDRYLKNAFEKLYHAITQYNSDIVSGKYQYQFGNELIRARNTKKEYININPLENQKNFNILSTFNGGGPCARIYKKDFILQNQLKFLENTNLEDIHFHLNCLKHSNKIIIFPNDIMYTYNVRDNSSIHSHTIKLLNNTINGMYSISQLLKDIKLDMNHILSYLISQLLLIFTNLDNNSKNNTILEIYKLEKYLEKKFNFQKTFPQKEVNILNNAIMQKKFKKAIFISNIYKKAYNNKKIQKIYKKIRSN